MNFKKGFTLIELLVVVAIIGVLASVVLAALNTARSKGSDAAVKSNLVNLRPQAEIYYDTYSCYTGNAGICSVSAPAVVAATDCATAHGVANSIFADSKFYSGVQAAFNAGLNYGACAETVGGTAWATVIQLSNPATGGTAWCVDSTGASKSVSVTATQAGLTAEVTGAKCL